MFPVGSSFPSTKTITFDNKKGGMDLLVHYSETVELLSGLPREISKYQIKDGKPKHEKLAFILRVSNNIHQIPCLESADLQEEWTEEEKIPVKKDVVPPKAADIQKDNGATEKTTQDTEMKSEESKEIPPKQDFEIRKKNKKSTVALKVETQSHALPNDVRKDFTSKESSWFNEDCKILEFKMIKNELESFTYDLKNSIDSYGPFEQYVDPSIRDNLLK